MVRVPRFKRPRGVVVAVVVAAALAFPLGVLASHQYSDVPDSNPYHADIDAITDAGVTTGCGGGKYCPTANVTRQEMAAFMNRLGALGPGKTPVVNANTSRSTDGWSIGCPSGTVLGGGLCFETSTRAANDFFSATEICANLGSNVLFGRGQVWELPTAFQLRAADRNGDINIADAAIEWSSTGYFDDGSFKAISVKGTGEVIDTAYGNSLPFRCAALPLQIDNNLIIIPLDQPQNGSAAKDRVNKQPGKNGAIVK